MKKFLQIPLLLVALFLTSIPISAHDFEVDGIFYEIVEKYSVTEGVNIVTASVTYKGDNYKSCHYSGDIVIPENVTINGTIYTVTDIAGLAFYNCSGLTSIAIPNSVTSIGYRTFHNCI